MGVVTVDRVLDRAAVLLETGGLSMGAARWGRRRCVLRAIADATAELGGDVATARAARDVLAGHVGVDPQVWADGVARRTATVAAALRDCAGAVRARESGVAARRAAPPPPPPPGLEHAAVPPPVPAGLLELVADLAAAVDAHAARIAELERVTGGAGIVAGFEQLLGGGD